MSNAPRTIDASGLGGKSPDGLRRIDRMVEQAALVMMPTGFVFILLGWMGASRTPLAFEQIPYLISGGLLGLGLIVGGGLLYVGGWIARSAQLLPKEQPEAGFVRALEGLSLVGGAAAAAPAGAWVRTPSGSMFHLAECSVVTSRDDVVRVTEKQAEKFKACGMCNPREASAA